ncbi:hypothetical protein D8B23_13945 [Verminephrobacter aporrectodeae subsp. tuberculatae]|uniref:Ig-like domain-containing protein n=2 Tax=Verminephrobacter aporrectodeae TaxID=1110389 RepID=UPI002244C7FB|nr:Ig-like domain-containing protein [Verminephrobacter aporrectodeae]MCW8199493.1 hypothetical protein [Verminephrobacter aporrectodeae subsp. tuberculatae]
MSVITAPAPMTGAHTKRAANNTVPDARAPSFHLQQTTISDEKLSRGESATVTLRFSQAIDARSFSLDDLVVGGGARLSNLYSTDGGTTWKVTLTAPGVQDSPANPSDARDSSGNQISVNLAGMTDLAGNAGVGRAVSTMTYDIDVRRPTATITLADSLLTAGETATVTFTFSEPVSGFDAGDINLSDANGTLGPLTPNANRTVWTASFTPTANASDVTNTLRVNLAGVTDDAGNAATGSATSDNYFVDTMRPTATITLADTALTAGETTTVTFRFSTSVTSFDASDINLSNANGTLGPLTSNANHTVWTATFTPTANVNDTTNTIRVNLTGVGDYMGNFGAISANYSVDTVRPTATITLADSALTVGETTTVTFTFNEPVNGFDANDINLSNANGTLGPLTPNANHTVWTATLTPTANVSAGANTIRVNLAGLGTDAGSTGSGNASSANYSVDTVRPMVAIKLADSHLTAGETTSATFRFSEPVTGFDASDIDLSHANGRLGPLTASKDGRTWNATFTPTNDVSDASNTIRVNTKGVRDLAGNTGSGVAKSAHYTVDTLAAPTLAATNPITISDDRLGPGESATVTIRFSEAIDASSFSLADLGVGDGAKLSDLHSIDGGITWEVTLTAPERTDIPSDASDLTGNQFRVVLAGVTDLAGNAGVGKVVSPVAFKRPMATITLLESTLTAGETTTVIFRFNEPVTGFDASDIDLSHANGTLGPLMANEDGQTWSATFTPTDNVNDASNTIRVHTKGVQDRAGNTEVGTVRSANYTVDTLARPTLARTDPITIHDDKLSQDERTTVIIRFSEAINTKSFSLADLGVTGGAKLSDLYSIDGGTTWAVTLTAPGIEDILANPDDVRDSTGNRISVNLAGVRSLAGHAGVGKVASTVTYDIDVQRPTLTITLAESALTVGASTTVTFSFSESVTGFDASDINLSHANGTLGPLTASEDGQTWSATFTPTANVHAEGNAIIVNTQGVRDLAGNAGDGIAKSNPYSVDTVPDLVPPELIMEGADAPRIEGNRLVLSYTEQNSLDAAILYGSAGFAVHSATGVEIGVGIVTVDANTKTVTLTLSRAVNNGELLTVSYVKPADSPGVQDTAGNAAANFVYMLVNNLPPASTPEGPDADHDSVSDVQEARAVSTGGAVTGDGNGDGIQDSAQATVASKTVATSGGSTASITLVVDSPGGSIPGNNTRIVSLEQNLAHGFSWGPGTEVPIGLMNFVATLETVGNGANFSLYLDPNTDGNGYWVRDGTAVGGAPLISLADIDGYWVRDGAGVWVNLASASYGGQMTSEGERVRLDFWIQDGGQFDADGVANGSISSFLGAAARMPLSIVGQTAEPAPGGG